MTHTQGILAQLKIAEEEGIVSTEEVAARGIELREQEREDE